MTERTMGVTWLTSEAVFALLVLSNCPYNWDEVIGKLILRKGDVLDVVEILRFGLPGLVFLLSMMSFRLLSKEQTKPEPDPNILKSIKQFMYVNIFLAVLTILAPLLDSLSKEEESIYNVQAKISGTPLAEGNRLMGSVTKEIDFHLSPTPLTPPLTPDQI